MARHQIVRVQVEADDRRTKPQRFGPLFRHFQQAGVAQMYPVKKSQGYDPA